MIDNIMIVLACMLVCPLVILTAGYILYKTNKGIKTWESGVKFITFGLFEVFTGILFSVVHIIRWVYPKLTRFIYWVTETEVPEKTVNPSLILSNPEALELADRFCNHPFETPTLSDNKVSDNGIFYCEIEALGLAEKYKSQSFDNIQIAKMAQHTIQNYYMETRFIRVMAHIDMASPTRLCFSVPLSEDGRRRLENRGQALSTDSMGTDRTPPLDEAIPEPPEIREGHGLDEEIILEDDTKELP